MTDSQEQAQGDLVLRQIGMGPMENFVYMVGSRKAGQCILIDPAWDIKALVEAAERENLRIVGAIATHFHFDHIGGSMFGMDVPGVVQLLEHVSVPVHANKREIEWIVKATGLSATDLIGHESDDTIDLGEVSMRFLHTPGHTPGSHCVLVDNRLITGDTLFVEGCGRTDLPGGDPRLLYESLTQKLAKLPPETVIYPGHDYGGATATMATALRSNHFMRARSFEEWAAMGGI